MIPASTRAAVAVTVDAVAENDTRAARKGIRMLIDAGAGHIDLASNAELVELLTELDASNQDNR